MLIEPTITWVPSGFWIWLDTKNCVKKLLLLLHGKFPVAISNVRREYPIFYNIPFLSFPAAGRPQALTIATVLVFQLHRL